MPEHFVEDMDDLLLYVARRAPRAFEGANLVRLLGLDGFTPDLEQLGRLRGDEFADDQRLVSGGVLSDAVPTKFAVRVKLF